MARIQRNKQLRPLHLFICEDSKSSKYYMLGLGRAKGINIRLLNAWVINFLSVYWNLKFVQCDITILFQSVQLP